MTIALGIIIQIVQFVLATVLDKDSSIKIFIADFSNKLAWTYVVCASIALAAAITKNSAKTGLAGLVAAPVGLYLATIVHKAVLKELAVSTVAEGGAFVLVPVIIKAIEYAILGIVFAYLRKNQKSLFQFMFTGFAAGVFFGTCQVVYKFSGLLQPLSIANILSMGLNELIIPVGCSIIIFASEILSKRVKIQGT